MSLISFILFKKTKKLDNEKKNCRNTQLNEHKPQIKGSCSQVFDEKFATLFIFWAACLHVSLRQLFYF